MQTNKQIIKKAQNIARLERKLALDKIKKRKADTRRKIEFGGLVIKAQMDNLSKEIILGALISAKKEINKEPAAKSLFKSIGQGAFMGFGEDEDDNRDTTN
jgi:hypothetical protein